MYSQVIDSTHYFIPKNELVLPIEQLKERFTVRSKFKDNEPIETFKETEKFFGVPRHYQNVGNIADRIIDARSDGTPIEFKFTSELRPRQIPLYKEFMSGLRQGNTGFLLNIFTGLGKTVLALKFLEEIGTTALVIVPRDFIIQQWKERILQHTDIKEGEIGIAQGPTCDFKGKKIVIGMIHSIAKGNYPEEFMKWPGVVIWDENHVLGALTFAKTVGMFPSRYRIGLSATMDRKDGMANVFKWAIGEKLITVSGTTDVVPTVFIKSYQSTDTKPHLYNKITDVTKRCGILLSAIAKDQKRNQMIAHYAKKFADSGRRTLILSARTEQLDTIRLILTQKLGFPHSEIGTFVGGTKKAQRQGILDNSRIILATMGVMSMAVDVPDLRALIFGTPLSDVEQSIGRILRMCEGSKDPVALDIVDLNYREALRWASSRRSLYIKNKAKIVELEGGGDIVYGKK